MIVIAVAREHAAAQQRERFERSGDELGVLGFHRHQIAGDEHEIRIVPHRSRADRSQARDRHERSEVRIGDLHDAHGSTFAGAATAAIERRGMASQALDDAIVELDVDDLAPRDQRLRQAEQAQHERQPHGHRLVARARRRAPTAARGTTRPRSTAPGC